MAKAKTTPKKAAPKPQSSEQLAFMLNQQYATIMQAQQQIHAINKELEHREKANAENEG